MAARTEQAFLELLRRRGAHRVRRVRFRSNRSTIWSLTRGGTVLNLHVAYRMAPLDLVDAFAVIAREAGSKTPAFREASARVRAWPALELELRRIRREHRKHRERSGGPTGRRRPRGVGPCCSTAEQRVYLRRLYRYFNRTRFDGRLPDDVPLRLSARFTSRLGQMVPGTRAGRRHVVEIALNVDLMLEGNGRERVDTLLHEMAHAADYLFDDGRGHGASWRRWARYVGCREAACAAGDIRRRDRRRVGQVTRVPPLPPAARAEAA